MNIHAFFGAFGLTGAAGKNTGPFVTDLGGTALGSTLSTVVDVGHPVHTGTGAGLLTSGTGEQTLSTSANFAGFAGIVAGTAVTGVVVVVYTDIGVFAVSLLSRTFGFDTLVAFANLVAVAGFVGFGPFITAFVIFDAALEFSGHFTSFGRTLYLAGFAARVVFAIRHTNGVFALFPLFAGREIFTGSPDIAFAGLNPPATSFSIGGSVTGAGGSVTADFAFVFAANGLFRIFAVLVFETFDATGGTLAILPVFAVLVGATDTTVIR